jgi:hypothetical protein
MDYASLTAYLGGIGSTLLSTDDLKSKGVMNIRRYRDIATHGLPALFGRYNYVVLLVPVRSEDNGHWIICIRHPDGIEYFDAYGGEPDRWIRNFPPLLHDFPFRYVNDVQFQSMSKGVATCGRWVVLRFLCRQMPLAVFQRAFGRTIRLTPDQICTLIVRKSVNH